MEPKREVRIMNQQKHRFVKLSHFSCHRQIIFFGGRIRSCRVQSLTRSPPAFDAEPSELCGGSWVKQAFEIEIHAITVGVCVLQMKIKASSSLIGAHEIAVFVD